MTTSFKHCKISGNELFYFTSASTIAKQFIRIIIWSSSTPQTFGPGPGASVVSSSTIDEREHTTVVLCGAFAT